jgi:hypothetical protein
MIFIFFVEGGGGAGGVLGVLIGGSEPEWEMRKTGWGGSTGCIMHRVHTSTKNATKGVVVLEIWTKQTIQTIQTNNLP